MSRAVPDGDLITSDSGNRVKSAEPNFTDSSRLRLVTGEFGKILFNPRLIHPKSHHNTTSFWIISHLIYLRLALNRRKYIHHNKLLL
ncbi:MAG: hypothetical protein A2020_16105 [Lentisphaerae bacterium GWF2_45_14]|nr:MAG: hypothetical protein A2020_16105 [Lentisphaerae bacterium GWF2_45_14]